MIEADREQLLANIQQLYKAIGADPGKCAGCDREIWWIITKNGKKAPLTHEALNHFADCPAAQNFRRK